MTDEINEAAKLIAEECDQLKHMLLEKNQNYGNSALDPLRIFATADRVEQIKVRIDDKLSRLKRGSAASEDVINDLLGYLILLRVAQRIHPVVKPVDNLAHGYHPTKSVSVTACGLSLSDAGLVCGNDALTSIDCAECRSVLNLKPKRELCPEHGCSREKCNGQYHARPVAPSTAT